MLRSLATSMAKKTMSLMPAEPNPDDVSLFEVFHLGEYADGTDEDRERLQLASSQYRYDEEHRKSFFQMYYPDFDTAALAGTTVLDLGCFTGGRLVYWLEHFDIREGVGIDINPLFAEAGTRFARLHNANASFHTGFAEALPFEEAQFDFIVCYDVFEHVQDVAACLQECHRVLKPGGRLLLVFPQYHQPAESHLGFVSRFPALQWFFPGDVLTQAFHEITTERGPSAEWYARRNPDLEPWERSPGLNGTSVRRFRRLVQRGGPWKLEHWSHRPIFSGRRSRGGVFKILSDVLSVPARMPVLEELFLSRICCMLSKPRAPLAKTSG